MVNLYVDGVSITNALVSSGTGNPKTMTINAAFSNGAFRKIGSDYASGGHDPYWDGGIASMMVYTTVLSPDQVMQNYNYFKHRFGK